MFFLYSIAGEYFSTNLVTKVKYDEDTLTDILWDKAESRCNTCGVDEFDSLEDVQSEVYGYNGEDFFIEDVDHNWDAVLEDFASL